MDDILICSDRHLSQKLERTEARSNAAFVETRAALWPESNARFIKVAGAYAMFDGIASPLTQTFCLGLFDEISAVELAKIESFFSEHGAKVCHEVSPLADTSLMPLLNKHDYHPVELSNVMFRSIDKEIKLNALKNPLITTRIIGPGEEKIWAKTSSLGWASGNENLAAIVYELGITGVHCPSALPFMAELHGQPIATGIIFIFDDIALFGGTSTIPESRGQGAQLALLEARLQLAVSKGCKIAMMCALPGSQSQRNAEKHGFRVAYTRTKWQKADIT